ncbi:MAG: 50S ribosomal protein L24e [Candidatus Nanoarchaeia archaeon]
MPKCTYCNKEFERSSGKMYIQNTGKILWFCSNKCEKYMLKLGRSNVRLKWTKAKKAKPAKA